MFQEFYITYSNSIFLSENLQRKVFNVVGKIARRKFKETQLHMH